MPPTSNTRGAGFDVLAKMRRKIAGIAESQFKQALGTELSAAALQLIADGFRGERDPYGKPWAPLKHRVGKILRDTGRLASSFVATPTSDGLSIRTNVAYAAVHQYGGTVKAHRREARVLFVNVNKGRFVSPGKARKKGGALRKGVAAHFLDAYTQGGFVIPQRQMVPMDETGGVGPIWGRALRRAANRFIRTWLEGTGVR